MATIAELYDRVAYPGSANTESHPARLAAMARMHGLEPAPLENCRVLEIGCNAGTNLVPMAYALPGSDFTGFDLAGVPVAAGQTRIEDLGLKNVRLLQADILEAEHLPELAGRFDYIITHGVYAWVPEPVREALLAYIRGHLTERGVAFVSYAALPGGRMRQITREIMAGWRPKPDETAAEMRESMSFLGFVAASRPAEDGFRTLLERELQNMERRGPEVVFHDEATPFYRPVYFRDFVAHAARHGLGYFSEAAFPKAADVTYQPETMAVVRQLAPDDLIAQEQILDYARMRTYRESLLCPQEASFKLEHQAEGLRQLFFVSQAVAIEGGEEGARAYQLDGKVTLETQSAATILLLDLLIDAGPEPLSFPELLAHLQARLPLQELELLESLMRLVATRFVGVSGWKPPIRREIAEKPFASRLARDDAARGARRVITLLHTVLDVEDPVVRQLLLLLDGTRDKSALLRALTEAFPNVPVEDLAAGLDGAMRNFNLAGVLEAR